MTLATRAVGEAGHLADHNVLHARYNALLVDHGNYYVSVDGDDTNDGLSWATAFRTVAHAAAHVATLPSDPPKGVFPDRAHIWVGRGIFVESEPIYLKLGMVIEGVSPIATEIRLADGANHSLIASHPGYAVTDYLHYAQVKSVRLIGNKANNTAGSGIDINMRTGESFRLDAVVAIGFPEHGIILRRGGAPCYLEDIHLFGNGLYGLNVTRASGDTWQTFQANLVSGDSNGNALIRVGPGGAGTDMFSFYGIKAEADPDQADVIELDTLNASPVLLSGVASLKSTNIVHIKGVYPRLTLHNVAASQATALIKDDTQGITVPYVDEVQFFSYGFGGPSLQIDGNRLSIWGSPLLHQSQRGVYSAANVLTDRTFDADATTVEELADVVGTLIADLRAIGLVV